MKYPTYEKGTLKEKRVNYKKLSRFPAEVCSFCKELFFDEETSKKIQELEG